MGNALIIEGVLLWSIMTILKIIIYNARKINLAGIIFKSMTIQLNGQNPEYGISLFQIVSIYWLLGGILFQILGNPELTGMLGIFLFILIYLLPVWIIASITKRRNKS